MQVIVNSLLTNYTRIGKGRLIVILPGWGDSLVSWRSFQEKLAKDFEVIVIDLPGFGGSQMPKEAWGLSDYADFVGSFLQKIALSPYAIVGHSNGGAIAIRGLATNQFSSKRLVLLASAGIRNIYKGRRRMIRLITKTGKIITTPLPTTVKKPLRAKVYRTIGSDMLVAENLQSTFKKIIEDDIQADAAKIVQPTLLIYGQRDQQTPLWYGQQLHQLINGSTLEVLSDADHFLQLDHSQAVLESLKEFLC